MVNWRDNCSGYFLGTGGKLNKYDPELKVLQWKEIEVKETNLGKSWVLGRSSDLADTKSVKL
jgi:hypothetical protein